MEVGIPDDKYKHYIYPDGGLTLSAAIDGDRLYILILQEDGDSNYSLELKKIDLDEFKGDENTLESIYKAPVTLPMFTSISIDGDKCLIKGSKNIALNKKDLTPIICDEDLKPRTGWDDIGRYFIVDDEYFRVVDFRDAAKGIDVFSTVDRTFSRHLNAGVDIQHPPVNGLLYGLRKQKEFVVCSVENGKSLFTLDLASYLSSDKRGKNIKYELCGSLIYILAGEWVFRFDLDTHSITHKIKYTDSNLILEAAERMGVDVDCLIANDLSAACDSLLITGGLEAGYLAHVNFAGGSELQWLVEGSRISAKNTSGDLVYGIENSRPCAWNKSTGKRVWEAKWDTISPGILTGDQWLVYSSISGHLQCFHWDEEYRSPLVC